MKKILFFLTVCSVMLSSCTAVYNHRTLQGNYDLRMNTKEELEIKGKTRIYLSEKDIEGDYDIISFNRYTPFHSSTLSCRAHDVSGIFLKPQMRKKFYEKAIKKAYELGGNAIIVTGIGTYTVISVNNWDSDNAEAAQYVNSILDTSILDKFTSGEIDKYSPREVKRYVSDLNNEIKFNLKSVKTSQEASVLEKKINALLNWNNSQKKPNSKLSKQLLANKKVFAQKQKRILKREAKAAKK